MYQNLKELNLNGLCQYNNTYQAYLFKNSNQVINCCNGLVFLEQSTCYIITPDTHQWYKNNTNEMLENHKLAVCNDPAVHMVPISPAEPSEINVFKTIARLTFLQTQNEQINNTHIQTHA